MTTPASLSLIQQRDLLKQLLANVEAQIAPPAPASASAGELVELSLEERFDYEKEVDKATPEIRVVIDREGMATVTGLRYDDLRDIVTAASLQAYADKFKAVMVSADDPCASVSRTNALESHRWYVRRRLLIDWLDDAVSAGLDGHNHQFHGSPRYHRARRPRGARGPGN